MAIKGTQYLYLINCNN